MTSFVKFGHRCVQKLHEIKLELDYTKYMTAVWARNPARNGSPRPADDRLSARKYIGVDMVICWSINKLRECWRL